MASIVYELSMPSNNAWNGRWSDEGRLFAIVKNLPAGKKREERYAAIVAGGPYRYSFGDGWVASVSAKIVDGREGAKIRRKSQGFCGYNWMVDSIERHGEILSS